MIEKIFTISVNCGKCFSDHLLRHQTPKRPRIIIETNQTSSISIRLRYFHYKVLKTYFRLKSDQQIRRYIITLSSDFNMNSKLHLSWKSGSNRHRDRRNKIKVKRLRLRNFALVMDSNPDHTTNGKPLLPNTIIFLSSDPA